ncbi:hypothetical protein F2Q70_00011637 [Brassica cretica]|uniref:Uncharacterized protein n=1 Tax=Brassica cretica TaxID=69181 RepID=A0A8S9H0V3_BRACR|nr:hypothetical protein F2Q68_00033993 [Brassica cretica]KAF2614040.1 hypothetical protein F2Q70_00011637 [Brassica cretica]
MEANPEKDGSTDMGGSDRAKELEEMWLGIGVHADDDDERDESVVSRDFGLLQRPIGPVLEEIQFGRGSSLRSFTFSFERIHGFPISEIYTIRLRRFSFMEFQNPKSSLICCYRLWMVQRVLTPT